MSVQINWDQLGFALTPTKSMYLTTTALNQPWQAGELTPFGNLSLSPAAGIFNYGQGIFEGMKAHRTKQGDIVLFRSQDNAERFQHSASTVAIPPVPTKLFIDAIKQVVLDNQDYIPPYGKGALYLRPLVIGSGALLGNAPAPEYTFVVFASPVGNYFKGGLEPIRIKVSLDYHRSAPLGTGHAKFSGNYAGCYPSTLAAKQEGFAVCLYLDGKTSTYVEEAGSANVFFRFGNTLKTPSLGSILAGITRNSIITLAREQLGLQVEECHLSIDEALQADEAFCTGTAAIITPIGELNYKDKATIFCNNQVGKVTHELYQCYREIQLCERDDPHGWTQIL